MWTPVHAKLCLAVLCIEHARRSVLVSVQAEQLRKAASQGDGQSTVVLQALGREADQQAYADPPPFRARARLAATRRRLRLLRLAPARPPDTGAQPACRVLPKAERPKRHEGRCHTCSGSGSVPSDREASSARALRCVCAQRGGARAARGAGEPGGRAGTSLPGGAECRRRSSGGALRRTAGTSGGAAGRRTFHYLRVYRLLINFFEQKVQGWPILSVLFARLLLLHVYDAHPRRCPWIRLGLPGPPA